MGGHQEKMPRDSGEQLRLRQVWGRPCSDGPPRPRGREPLEALQSSAPSLATGSEVDRVTADLAGGESARAAAAEEEEELH